MTQQILTYQLAAHSVEDLHRCIGMFLLEEDRYAVPEFVNKAASGQYSWFRIRIALEQEHAFLSKVEELKHAPLATRKVVGCIRDVLSRTECA